MASPLTSHRPRRGLLAGQLIALIALLAAALIAAEVRVPILAEAASSPRAAWADVTGQQIAVPSYINPGADPGAWNRLIGADSGKAGIAVANVLNGPDYVKKPAWTDVIRRTHASGKRVLGYVDTGYLGLTGLPTRLGSTATADWIAQIDEDINAWYAFYGDQIGGIFFDEGYNACGTGNQFASWYSHINQYVKRHYAGSMTVLNPGYAVPQCYENTADVLLTYESDYDGYFGHNANPGLNYADPGWVPANPRKFWHIIYNVPAAHIAEVIAASKARHAGYVYVTDDVLANPYDTIPADSYWGAELGQVTGGAAPPAPAAALPKGQPAPGRPTQLNVVNNDYTSATLAWGAAANAAVYYVYVNGHAVASLPASMRTVTIKSLVPGGRKYRFHIVAQGASGQMSAPSSGVTAITAALPRGQTVLNARTGHIASGYTTFTADFLNPYSFRRVFIAEGGLSPSAQCWRAGTYTVDIKCARYLIENTTLFRYSGDNTGTQWQWTAIGYAPPAITGYTYSWAIKDSDILGASDDALIQAEGYGPATYVSAHIDDIRGNGITPAVLFGVAAVILVCAVVGIVTGGAAIPAEAAVTGAEFELGAAELGTEEFAATEAIAEDEAAAAADAAEELGVGEWQAVNESMSPRAAEYQARVTGAPPGWAYVVDTVKFDGFTDGVLLDAKGPGYATFVQNGRFVSWWTGRLSMIDQGLSQGAVAKGAPVTWYVAESEVVPAIEYLFEQNGVVGINVVFMP